VFTDESFRCRHRRGLPRRAGTHSRADLGPDLGKFSFRRWSAKFDAQAGQRYVLASRAVSNAGEGQVQRWNPSGYARNAVENVSVSVAS
jgi:sulfite dehydrogenase